MERGQQRCRVSTVSKTVLLFAFLLVAATTVAQDDYVVPTPNDGFWGSAYMASGSSSVERRELVMADYRTLLAGSDFSQVDLSAYNQNQFYSNSDEAASAFVFGASFYPLLGHNGKGPELRVGFAYMGGRVGRLELERSERFVVDTLNLSVGGNVFLVDSTYTSRYQLEHSSERFGLEAALLFRTDQLSRWSVYGGASLGFGARFNVLTTVTRTEESSTNLPGIISTYVPAETGFEQLSNSGGFWLLFQAPIGLGFRVAKHGDFWGRMELYLEGRPGTMVQASKEFGTRTTFGSQFLFGLRVRLG